MIKTIKIDEKPVEFKITGSFALRYQAQFGEDILQKLFPVITEVFEGYNTAVESGAESIEEIFPVILANLYSVCLTDIQNILWVLAKTADETIPEPILWYDQFESFPMIDVLKEIGPVFLESLITKKKLTTKKAKKAKSTQA